jgi:hypothetical protein
LKYHLSEIVDLEKTSLKRGDDTGSPECDKQLFHRIEVDYAV